MSETKPTPVLFLDVDGVLNMFGRMPPHNFRDGVAAADDVDPEHPEDAYRYKICWNPKIVEQLNTLIDDGKVRGMWLTTWGRHANGELRELIGIRELEVAHDPSRSDLEDYYDWWKFRIVKVFRHRNPDIPIIWIDDDLNMEKGALAWCERDGNILTVSPLPHETLSTLDMLKVEKFIKLCAETPEQDSTIAL